MPRPATPQPPIPNVRLPALGESGPGTGVPTPPRRRGPRQAEPRNTPRAQTRDQTPALSPAERQRRLLADLEQALAIDSEYRTLFANRGAEQARSAITASPIIYGSPALGALGRGDTRGTGRAREFQLEFAMPVWLPGQRSALGAEIAARVSEADGRILRRQLEVAGLLRDALWTAALAMRDAQVARERLATARDIARDIGRQAQLGDISELEALLPRNEVLAAELELVRAEAAADTAATAYRTLTGGADPAPGPEPLAAGATIERHPAIRAAEASVAAAEAQSRYVAATPRDNPEIGLYGQQQNGYVTENGSSIGFRLRLPLATEARNAPRRAAAEAAVTGAQAQLIQRRRQVEGEIAIARRALRAAEEGDRVARARLEIANRQTAGALTAFRAGETGLFDLYRVRQLQVDAAYAQGRAEVELGRARARLNQAQGVLPGGM
nr:TolC family protein [Roseomonas acroporae]